MAGAIIAGALLLGLLGAAPNGKQQPARRTPRKPARPAAEVQADKDLQEALNYFGFNAGTVDGAPGRQIKAAVATLQSTLNTPATGAVTEYERGVLRDAMARARVNSLEALQLAAANPLGQRGLPSIYRDMALGKAPPQAAQSTPTPAAQPVPAAQPAQPVPAAQPAQGAALSDDELFDAPIQPARSANELCSQTANFTSDNGGLASAANMPDPTLALNEQFCLARGFASSEGTQTAASVNASQEQITSCCTKLKAILATAAAVALAATGLKPCAEMIGHNLREGSGTLANPQASKAWVAYALDALKAGNAPAFLPGQSTERAAILSAALAGL